jgi:hypothetical protein
MREPCRVEVLKSLKKDIYAVVSRLQNYLGLKNEIFSGGFRFVDKLRFPTVKT